MLSITSKKTLGVSHQTTQRTSHHVRPSRTARPIAVAGLKESGDWLASGILKNFTPPSDSGVNWTGTSTGYSIPPRRARARGSGPVGAVDNQRASDAGETVAVTEEERKTEEVQGMLAQIAEYLSGALQRVMGHNFKGDETEPDWKSSGQEGWTGDSRKRDQDGFHSRKL